MQPKVYLAGPEVFLPNATEYAEKQCQLCYKYNFVPLHPMDNTVDLGKKDYETATRIYQANVNQIHECNIIIANCNPFRSMCVMDDGTAYELGFGNALGKISYGYITKKELLTDRTTRDYPTQLDIISNLHIDKEGYAVTDAFDTSINLMMQCGMSKRLRHLNI